MPVPSSGQLSLRNDIALNVGGSSTSNISLRDLSSRAGFSTPDAMSEFYGYARNLSYFNTRRGQVRNVPDGSNNTQRATYMGWFRVDSLSKKNQVFFGCGRDESGRRNMIRAVYYQSINRISVEWYDSTSRRRMRRQYPLHDNPNRSITGVTSSGTGWVRSQRGNTDADGFVHICVSVDLSSRSYTGIRLYWNAQELTYSVNNQSSSVNPSIENRVICIANSNGNSIGSSSNFEGGIDNFLWIGQNNYNITQIQTVYNAGNTFPPGVASPYPPLTDGNGYFIYGVQGFDGGINNDYGWLLIQPRTWQYLGSSYSIAYY